MKAKFFLRLLVTAMLIVVAGFLSGGLSFQVSVWLGQVMPLSFTAELAGIGLLGHVILWVGLMAGLVGLGYLGAGESGPYDIHEPPYR